MNKNIKKIMAELMDEVIKEFSLPSPFALDGDCVEQAEEELKKGNKKKAKSLLAIAAYKEGYRIEK